MRIETIDPIHEQPWGAFLLQEPRATVFHSAAWARVLYDTYGFQHRYMVAREDDGRVVAGIPLFQVKGGRLVGLPFSDLCPPLLPDDDVGSTLLDVTKRTIETDGITSIELRGHSALDLE